jgi:hypothetical protein
MLGLKDKMKFATHIKKLADTPDLVRVIVSHHRMITDEPAAVLRGVAEAL